MDNAAQSRYASHGMAPDYFDDENTVCQSLSIMDSTWERIGWQILVL